MTKLTLTLRESLRARLAGSQLPSYMHGSLEAYLLDHRPAGRFLTAVLQNNLQEAVRAADADNLRHLADYVLFLVDCAPAVSWGSAERVEDWVALEGDHL